MMIFIFLISSATTSAYREEKIQSFTRLTKLPHLVLSTSYLQKRIFYYDDYSNRLYPSMQKQNKLGFVYAQ